jgi:hypothetical protein
MTGLQAGLVLATTTLFLSSQPPIEHLMAYNSSVSYIFAMISFGAALLSVISGAAVLVIYETSTTHKDMETLKVRLFVWAGSRFDTRHSTCHDIKSLHSCYGWHTPQSVCQSLLAFCLCVSGATRCLDLLLSMMFPLQLSLSPASGLTIMLSTS